MNFDLSIYDDFLTEKECSDFINLYSPAMESLPFVYGKAHKLKYPEIPVRTVSAKFINQDGKLSRTQHIVDDSDLLVKKIKNKFSELTQTPLENQEPFMFVKYEERQEFYEHTDNFPNFDIHKCRRTHSLIIYFNDCDGGETNFTVIDKKIKPKTGRAVLWNNIKDGNILKGTDHASLPVKKGYKYAGILWVREVKYGGPV